MLRSLIASLLLATSLVAQEAPSASLVAEPTPSPLLVHEYVDLLKTVATTSDRHGLYQPSMSDQVIQEKTVDGFSYVIVADQENQPIHHLTELDAMSFCNWKDHGSPRSGADLQDSIEHGTYDFSGDDQLVTTNNNGEYQVAADEACFSITHFQPIERATSPLMMLHGEERKVEEEKTEEEHKRQQDQEEHNREATADPSREAARAPDQVAELPAEPRVPEANPQPQNNYWAPPRGAAIFLTLGLAAKLLVTKQLFLHQQSHHRTFSLPDFIPNYTTSSDFSGPALQLLCNHLLPSADSSAPTVSYIPKQLVTWLGCHELPDAHFYSQTQLLKKKEYRYSPKTEVSDSSFYCRTERLPSFEENISFLKLNQEHWNRIAQQCKEKTMTISKPGVRGVWNQELKDAETKSLIARAQQHFFESLDVDKLIFEAEKKLRSATTKNGKQELQRNLSHYQEQQKRLINKADSILLPIVTSSPWHLTDLWKEYSKNTVFYLNLERNCIYFFHAHKSLQEAGKISRKASVEAEKTNGNLATLFSLFEQRVQEHQEATTMTKAALTHCTKIAAYLQKSSSWAKQFNMLHHSLAEMNSIAMSGLLQSKALEQSLIAFDLQQRLVATDNIDKKRELFESTLSSLSLAEEAWKKVEDHFLENKGSFSEIRQFQKEANQKREEARTLINLVMQHAADNNLTTARFISWPSNLSNYSKNFEKYEL